MKISIQDRDALIAILPTALSNYAYASGWKKKEAYGRYSDVYVHKKAPDIIIPRTQNLGDYASIVSRLIEIFAEVSETDILSLYRNLITADCDIVRVKVASEGAYDSVSLDGGLSLIKGARSMIIAAARSLQELRPIYLGSLNQKTKNYVQQVHFGQTEPASCIKNRPIRAFALRNTGVSGRSGRVAYVHCR